MGQLKGQFVAITGLDGSLRTAAAERARAEGAEVALIDASADAVRKAAEKAGKLDALVNVLRGSTDWHAFADGSDKAVSGMLGQVEAIASATRAAYPWLKKSRGRVVNVCSVYGATSYAGISETVAADYALKGLTRAVGVEWAKDDIQVNCIVPGALDVPELRAFRNKYPADVDQRIHGISAQRLGDPVEDFGGALMLLLSDEGCFLVGHPVYADGGQHLAAAVFEPGAPFARSS